MGCGGLTIGVNETWNTFIISYLGCAGVADEGEC